MTSAARQTATCAVRRRATGRTATTAARRTGRATTGGARRRAAATTGGTPTAAATASAMTAAARRATTTTAATRRRARRRLPRRARGYDRDRDRDRGYDRPSPRSAPKRRRSEDEGRERDDRRRPADRGWTPRDRGRAPPPARRAGGGWGKKAGVGPCDPEYALKLELLRKRPASTRRSSSSATSRRIRRSRTSPRASTRAGDRGRVPDMNDNTSFTRPRPRFAMATAVYFIPPCGTAFSASAAFFLSATPPRAASGASPSPIGSWAADSREGGGFSVASAMASCSAATQASLVFPFGSVPSRERHARDAQQPQPVLVDALDHCTSCKYMSSSLSLTSRHVPSGLK